MNKEKKYTRFEMDVIGRLTTVEANLKNHLSAHKNDRKFILGILGAILIAIVVDIVLR